MMKWTTKFSTVLGCALAAVFLFTSTMEVGAVPLTSSPSGTTTTTTTDTNAAEDGNADAAAETETLMQPQRITQQGQLPQEPLPAQP